MRFDSSERGSITWAREGSRDAGGAQPRTSRGSRPLTATGSALRCAAMPVEWAGLGPDLLLALDRDRAEPLRAQLERELREAIRSGRLAAGERLPSSRALAAELGISRGLVLECYSQLQAEGFLTSRSGSATRVAASVLAPAELPGGPRRRSAARRRLPPRRSGPDELSRGATGPGRCGRPAATQRRPSSATAILAGSKRCARCWRRIPAPGARRGGRPRAGGPVQRLRAGDQPRAALAVRRGGSGVWRSRTRETTTTT